MAAPRVGVALLLVLAVAAAPGAGAQSSRSRLPAPVTFEGVGGVIPDMSLADVRRRWGRFAVSYHYGNTSVDTEARGAICAGRMHGEAVFYGPPPNPRFVGALFTAGARTDKGVGIGSTLAQLRTAYGGSLERDRPAYNYTGFILVADTPPPRRAIYFEVNNRTGRVQQIRYGLREIVFRLTTPGVWTVDC